VATMTVRSTSQTQDERPTARASASFWRWTGIFGLAVVALTWAQFPLWTVGTQPPAYNGGAFAQHLFNIKTVALTRILMDLGIYLALMLFAVRLGQLIRQARAGFEWLATLVVGSAMVWIGVTLVADGLEGGAVLDTLRGNADASAVRALIDGTLLIYNGSTAFVLTGLFVGAAGYATFATGVLPRWTGWLAYAAAALCALSVPAMYAGPVDYTGFYNAGGWGPAIIANFPPLIWFVAVGIVMVRQHDVKAPSAAAAKGKVTRPEAG
jgi:hypothetical protein